MSKPTFWHIPYERNSFFTGRDEELAQIHAMLQLDTRVALSHPLGISGLGGIGKTQAALEYVYRYSSEYEAVFWLLADSATSLTSSLVKLAHVLDLPEQNAPDHEMIVQAVLRWFHRHSNWLLIYDNIDDLSVAEPFLPKTGTGHLLFTTRAQAIGGLAQRLDIEKWNSDIGALFLLRRAALLALHDALDRANPDDQHIAQAISQELDGLPLALDQAGAYIKETSCTLQHYLSSYQSRRSDLLRERGSEHKDYPASVATTWSLSFEKVSQVNRAASELLDFCAFLAPDGIPESLISESTTVFRNPWVSSMLAEISDNPLAFDQAMKILLNYSLITRQIDKGLFSMHRLVQAVIWDAATQDEKNDTINMKVIPALSHTFPDPQDIRQWQSCALYIPHVLYSMKWIIEGELFFEDIGELLFKAGFYLQKLGRYHEAEQLYTLCIQIFQDCGDEVGIAVCLNMLGVIHQVQRHYQQAEDFYQGAEDMLKSQTQDVSFILTAIQDNRAEMYRDQGNFKRASHLYEQNFLKQKELPEETSLDSTTTLNNRALLLTNQGKYEEAEQLYQQALAIHQKELGYEHPDVANSLNNLAAIYRLNGQYTEAEQSYLQALAIMEQHYGTEHPSVAFILNNLGELYRLMGQYKQAEDYILKALMIREKQQDNPLRAMSLISLGVLYIEQGKYVKGEMQLKQALELEKQYLGSDHPDIATTLNDLGIYFMHLSNFAEAEEYLTQALAMREGLANEKLALSLNNMATLRQMQKKYIEAERFYQRALAIQEAFPGPQKLDLARTLSNLGELYRLMRKHKQAKETLIRAVNIYQEADQVTHPNMAPVLNNLGLIADERRFYDVAERLYLSSLVITEHCLGANHPDLIFPLYNLAYLYERRGKKAEAEKYYQRALNICEDLPGNKHPLIDRLHERYTSLLAQEPSGSKKLLFELKFLVNWVKLLRKFG